MRIIARALGLLFVIGLTSLLGQIEPPGVFGRITSRPKAGDLAPDINFDKVLGRPVGSTPWSPAKLRGQVTVLNLLPYVSGNPYVVAEWNALVQKFADSPVQFAWIAGEPETTLLPFLQGHPLQGWVFLDLEGKTANAYGLESPQAILIGADRKIAGFAPDILPLKAAVDAVLEHRIALTPRQPTLQDLLATLSQRGSRLLSPEAERMPHSEDRQQDHRPAFSPSLAVHIAPAGDKVNYGDYLSDDYWNLQGYTISRLLAEVLEMNPIRIDLPASIDVNALYDVSIVLPAPQSHASMRGLIRQGVEDYFHLTGIRENRLREVYVLTAPEAEKLPVSKQEWNFGFSSSTSSTSILGAALQWEGPHSINAIESFFTAGATVDEFCNMLELQLDRPIVNETGLDGKFDFNLGEPEAESPKRDFVGRLRDRLGLTVARDERRVETMVYRIY